jgi:hypothetical protein
VLGLYRLFGFACLIISIQTGMQNEDHKQVVYSQYITSTKEEYLTNPIATINLFAILLPLLAFTYDYQVLRLLKRQEFKAFKITKVLFAFGFWLLLISSYLSYNNDPKEPIDLRRTRRVFTDIVVPPTVSNSSIVASNQTVEAEPEDPSNSTIGNGT